jgi:hypothetical protein
MIRFYTNKVLARKLDVNLAKWKRWSREFLPPDPLGGLQSGYARQYNPDEAFTVILGGHLVGELKFTIPDARQIINDLRDWLAAHEFYFNYSGNDGLSLKKAIAVKIYQIDIIRKNIIDPDKPGFLYRARGIISDDRIDFSGHKLRRQHFIESPIGSDSGTFASYDSQSYRVLNISAFRDRFLKALAEGDSASPGEKHP